MRLRLTADIDIGRPLFTDDQGKLTEISKTLKEIKDV